MVILYTINDNNFYDLNNVANLQNISCYVNCTNRCCCACSFCLRKTKHLLKENSLWLEKEPSVAMIIEEFEKYDINLFKEVVFCGYGEPLMRHDDLMAVAKYLKGRRKDLIIRINTNGLASVERDITRDFEGLIDIISVSLNAPTKLEYFEITHAKYGIDSFDYLLDFVKRAKKYVPKVMVSVVDVIGESKIAACQKIAASLDVELRVRPFED